jgi:ABC-2 type transport system ATP-binding protein
VLTLDLNKPSPPLTGIRFTRLVDVEPDGLRQRLAFSPHDTTAAAVLAEVGERTDVRDLTIEEPDIEDVVRRLYLATPPPSR